MVSKKNMWTISQLASEFDISTRTIRFYEEKNLLCPERSPGGHRKYSRRERARLKLILRGKRFGHSLEEIAEMIGLASDNMDEREQIKKTMSYGDKNLAEIKRKIEELQLMEAEITSMKQRLLVRLAELDAEEE